MAAVHLRQAEAYLAHARQRLDASPPDHAAALAEVQAAVRASLLAAVLGFGGTPDPGASLAALAERAVRTDSLLKTAAHRALRLDERAPAIARATAFSVHDREDVETGWYTARNLYRTVAARLGASQSLALP